MYQLFLPWKLGLPFKICLAPKNKKVKKKNERKRIAVLHESFYQA